MTAKPPPGLFITGTHTGVGKTYVTALIARSLRAAGCRVGIYKPVVSGCVTDLSSASPASLANSPDDDVRLWLAAGQPGDCGRVSPQRFRAPLAPHLAARVEGREIDHRLLRTGLDYWRNDADVVLVEGAGGLMSPVTDDEYVADLAWDFGYPLLVVARNELGVIHQTLQTLITAATFRDGLALAGIVLNHVAPADPADHSLAHNRAELDQRCIPPVLAELAFGADAFQPAVDWLGVARRPRKA